MNIFVSVGTVSNRTQELLVEAIEKRLKSEGLNPLTLGRNYFSSDAPLKAITDLMNKCHGTVVIALERTYFPSGIERRGGNKEVAITNTMITTPWNHIEAALSYSQGLPLLVIVANGVRTEGLLEPGHDWFVQRIDPKANALQSPEFNGVLADWKLKLSNVKKITPTPYELEKMSLGEIIFALKPKVLWGILGGAITIIVGSFTLGAKLIG